VIRFQCASCGKRLAVKEQYVGWPTKCLACGTVLKVPPTKTEWPPKAVSRTPAAPDPTTPPATDQAVPDVPAPIESAEPPVVESKRPLWKDPVVVVGTAVPTLIMVWFFGYLVVEHIQRGFYEHAIALKAEADELERTGQHRQAFGRYEDVMTMIKGKLSGGGPYDELFEAAETSRNRLYPIVKRELDREATIRLAQEQRPWIGAPIGGEEGLFVFLFGFVILSQIAGACIALCGPRRGRRRG
jgi:hypothetical protein